MSLRFDARCSCAGCGTPIDANVMEHGGHRVSTKELGRGKREVIADVSSTCTACGSRRVRLVTRVDVGAG